MFLLLLAMVLGLFIAGFVVVVLKAHKDTIYMYIMGWVILSVIMFFVALARSPLP